MSSTWYIRQRLLLAAVVLVLYSTSGPKIRPSQRVCVLILGVHGRVQPVSVLGLVLFIAVLMRSRRCTGIRPNNFVFLVFLHPWLLGLTFVLDRRARSPSRELLVALPACECSSSFAATPPAPLPPVLNTRQDLQGSPLHTHEATAASHRVRHALVGARTIVHFVFCHRGSGVPCFAVCPFRPLRNEGC